MLRLTLALALVLALSSCATAPESGTDCSKRPSCVKYLTKIRKRVYSAWRPANDVQSGAVTISFRVDSDGRLSNIRVVRSDSDALAASCKQAMESATRLPRLPEGLAFLLQKNIVATFDFKRSSS